MAYRKLTESQVIELRDEHDRLLASHCRVATFYRLRASELGVHVDTIRAACTHKSWPEVIDGRSTGSKSA